MRFISKLPSKILILCIIILASVSCRCLEVVSGSEVQNVQMFRSVDTIVVHDSVFVREQIRGDTVYLTRTEWRDRWRVRIERDTIRETEYITQTIEHPPEKYVPPFYKRCTIALWGIVVLAIGYGLLKWRLGRLL